METGRYRSAPPYLVAAAVGFTLGTTLIAGIASIALGDGPRPALGIGALAIPLFLTCLAVVAWIAPAGQVRASSTSRPATVVALADVARPDAGIATRLAAKGEATLRRAA